MRPQASEGDSLTRPIRRCSRAASPRRSSSVRKVPSSHCRPCDSIVSRLGCRREAGRRSLTCAQCRGNTTCTQHARSRDSTLTASSVTVIVWRRCRRDRLLRNAHPSSSISRPENGSTGQNPCAAMRPATAKDTRHSPAKNVRAPRTLNEQLGEISMLWGAAASTRTRVRERRDFIQVKGLHRSRGCPRRGRRRTAVPPAEPRAVR